MKLIALTRWLSELTITLNTDLIATAHVRKWHTSSPLHQPSVNRVQCV
jgi:hypothetical protein